MGAFVGAIMAGILTGMGGAAFLASDHPAIGALLFSFGLFAALALGFPLYIGRCAQAILKKPHDWLGLLLLLLGNLLGAALTGLLFGLAVPLSKTPVVEAAKLAQPLYANLIRATFCGVIIAAAVASWKQLSHSRAVGVLLGVTAFIVSGFNNSIADAFYFGAALGQTQVVRLRPLLHVAVAVLGNTLGALLVYLAMQARETAQTNDGKAL